MSYSGKEVCQGCWRPGNEISRRSKSDLCGLCRKAIDVGKARINEDAIPYTSIRQFYHAFSSLEFTDHSLNKACIDTLRALDNPSAVASSRESLKQCSADNVLFVKIPTDLVEPLTLLFNKLDDFVRASRDDREAIQGEAKEAVRDQKNQIYNDGVAKGRDLLSGLNSGEYTLDQFNKFQQKY